MNTISAGICEERERIERAFPSWMAPTFQDGPMGFPPELSDPCVDLSGLLGTPAIQDATPDWPVDSPKPGECFYCKTKAVRMTGDGRPVCLFHKQFFFTRQLREDDLCG